MPCAISLRLSIHSCISGESHTNLINLPNRRCGIGSRVYGSPPSEQKRDDNQELRLKAHELSQQLRKFSADYAARLKAIEDNCISQGRNRSPSCGANATNDEHKDAERTFRDQYLPGAVSLRSAMLAKLPPQPQPGGNIIAALNADVDLSAANDLADYLDELAIKLP